MVLTKQVLKALEKARAAGEIAEVSNDGEDGKQD
jgi:hypothetical protein